MRIDWNVPEVEVPLPVADIALMTAMTAVFTVVIGTFVLGLAALL